MDSDGRGRSRFDARDETGAVVVILAAGMAAMLVMVALVLDMSGARRDRDADQVAADAMAMAAAGGLGNPELPGVAACDAAWDYLVVNLPTVETRPAKVCTAFNTICTPTVARQMTFNVSEYRITMTHPVPADHALLAAQPSHANDGIPCDRVGIRIQETRANLTASGSVEVDVSAVARFVRGVGDANAPLILLSEHGCGVMRVSGNGSMTVHTSNGGDGYIAIDSDGGDCLNPNRVVLDVNGQGSITADKVYMWALADGDTTSAYSSGLISPTPEASSGPVGRWAMDWRYNCKAANGCPGTHTAYLDTMISEWGSTGAPLPLGSFTSWTASGRSCSPTGDIVVPFGNWWIDCGTSGLSTNGTLTFQGGDIVADGPISATGTAGLRINCSDANPNDLVAPSNCPADPPSPSIYFLRSGDLLDGGNLEMRETFVYAMTGTSRLAGQNQVTWTAPNDPTFRFDDLALWTESADLVKFTGGVNLKLEGIVFAPNAHLELAGNTGTEALLAQLWVKSLDMVGGAQFRLVPSEDRITKVGKGKQLLIR